MNAFPDTIVAPATGAGPAPIAIVRLSGPKALDLLKSFCISSASKTTVNTFSHHRLTLAQFVSPGDSEPLDEVMAVYMPAPHTYTGEDVVEIHCHGSPAIVAQIVETLCRAGARLAQPGEFTRRAFLNGRLDLAQAEAVCDLVRSATASASRLALRQLSGRLSVRIGDIRRRLVEFSAEVEARLDFPDEPIAPADRRRLADWLRQAQAGLADLLRQGRCGRVFRDGARVAIVGRPNVGKSSLFNALLGRERAIVSPHPGTTRDTIECTLDLRGIATTLVDTAGWRAAAEDLERLGVERTAGEITQADLILWVVDASEELTDEDRAIAERLAALPVLVVCNKTDLPMLLRREIIRSLGFAAERILPVSAIRREGLREVEEAMVAALTGGENAEAVETPLVSNARHLALLEQAYGAVCRSLDLVEQGVSEDLVMVEVRGALGALDEILGLRFADDLLDEIFARFCIGK